MTLDNQLTWYLAGPMSNVPQFNIPKFEEIACLLRDQGLVVVSPPEQDSPAMQVAALASPDGDLAKLEKDTNETWGDVLSRDVKLVADDVGGIVFLPDWQKSRGARLEAFVGLLTGKKFAAYFEAGSYDGRTDGLREKAEVCYVSTGYVRYTLRDNMP